MLVTIIVNDIAGLCLGNRDLRESSFGPALHQTMESALSSRCPDDWPEVRIFSTWKSEDQSIEILIENLRTKEATLFTREITHVAGEAMRKFWSGTPLRYRAIMVRIYHRELVPPLHIQQVDQE